MENFKTVLKSIQPSLFFKDTFTLAQDLLGCVLLSCDEQGSFSGGRIVEVEGYPPDDEASHAFRGVTNRCETMFLKAGKIYVYLIYGIYHCFNIVSEKEGLGAAILIRALEPLWGIEMMKKRRKEKKNLTSGPGCLCEALGIDKTYNKANLYLKIAKENNKKGIYLLELKNKKNKKIVTCPRIGIKKNKDVPWRYYLEGNSFISKK